MSPPFNLMSTLYILMQKSNIHARYVKLNNVILWGPKWYLSNIKYIVLWSVTTKGTECEFAWLHRWRGETATSRSPMLFPGHLVEELVEEENDQQPLGTLQKGSLDIQGCRTGKELPNTATQQPKNCMKSLLIRCFTLSIFLFRSHW